MIPDPWVQEICHLGLGFTTPHFDWLWFFSVRDFICPKETFPWWGVRTVLTQIDPREGCTGSCLAFIDSRMTVLVSLWVPLGNWYYTTTDFASGVSGLLCSMWSGLERSAYWYWNNTLLLYVVFREADLACADSTSLTRHSSGSDLILYILDFKFEWADQ